MERKRTTPRLITGRKTQTPTPPEEPDVQLILQAAAPEELDVQLILQEMRVPELLSRIPRRPDLKVEFKEDIEKFVYKPDWMWIPGNIRKVTWKRLRPGRYFLLELFRRRTYALVKKWGKKSLVKLPRYMSDRCKTWRAGSYIKKTSD